MKKIFTFILLSVVAIATSALPHSSLPLLTQAASDNTQAQEAVAQAMMQFKRDVTKHALRPMQAEATPSQDYSIGLTPLRKADAEPIVLNGQEFLVGPEYEAKTNEWYIALEAQGFTFRICWTGSADTYCGKITIDNLVPELTWGWYQSTNQFYEIALRDIDMTVSEKVTSEYLKQIILDGTITDTEDNVYKLHATHNLYTPKNTVENVINNAQLTAGSGNFILDGNNADIKVKLTVNSSTIDGVYTQKNLDTKNTQIVYKGVEQQVLQANLQVVSGTLANGAMGYLTTFSFYNQDTILHQVTIPAGLPTPKDTIRISCTNLIINEDMASQNMYIAMGSSADYDVLAIFEAKVLETGEYNNVSVSISDMVTWEMVETIRAKLILKETATSWEATIEAYCTDYNYYCIDMKFVVPEPTDTVKIAFEEPAIATYQQYNQHLLQLLNYSQDYEASISIFDVQLGDSFTIDNVYMTYSGINKTNEYAVDIADITGTLNQYGDTTVIQAKVISFDAVLYDVTWWYAVPTPIDTVAIDMPIEFINSMADGYYTLSAFTPDSAWYISLSPITQEVAGTFTNDGLFGKFGAADGAYDFYGGNSFIRAKDGEMPHTVEKGTLEVKLAADSTIFAEAKLICSNAIYYHIKMVSAYNEHLEYDEPYSEVDRTYTIADNVQIENKIAEAGYVYLCITAADDTDQAAFFFFAEDVDPDIIIPVGVYPINDSQDYGTVLANPGVQGAVWPSFYAELADDGNLATPLWLLVEGTVEVSKNDKGEVYMEVNARNSYGVPVHIVYEGTMTGVTDILPPASQPTKFIQNGVLIIRRNGVNYNAQGAVIQ